MYLQKRRVIFVIFPQLFDLKKSKKIIKIFLGALTIKIAI